MPSCAASRRTGGSRAPAVNSPADIRAMICSCSCMKIGRPLPFESEIPNALGSVACLGRLWPFAIRRHSIQEILYDLLYDCEQTQEKNCMIYATKPASRLCVVAVLITSALLSPAAAQDIRGVEKCTAEA